jgi:hypothetical protein
MKLWKDIEGYEGLYQVSSEGEVYSVRSERYLKVNYSTKYPFVGLCKNGESKNYFVHRLLAKAFIPNPDSKKTVNHKDGNKLNNSLENLEWATNGENQLHAYKNGFQHSGEDHHKTKMTAGTVRRLRSLYDGTYQFCVAEGARLGLHPNSVLLAVTYKTWKYIDG